MYFEKQPMVNWYDLGQLVSTGIKAVISGIFGNFADKREFQAAYAPDETFYDLSLKNGKELNEIWVDFISDLGDGFDATYTMAHLLAQEELQFGNEKTKRGDVLIMGGDEVYPTPEKNQYDNRMKGPYFAAFPWRDDSGRPKLFAIPGNHDWYDGLTNFTKVFCQQRSIGNWQTRQMRSYFAIKLPHNYWILATDIQLNSDIDDPQKRFFKKIAREDIKGGDKIIVCTAEPTWVYRMWSIKNTSDARFDFFINKIILGEDEDFYGRARNKARIVAILTGDLHHYSRYIETDKNKDYECQLFTAGGGGAFTHPTHFLKPEERYPDNMKRVLGKTTFPSKKQSRKLAWMNLAFPFLSLKLMLFFGFFHLLTTWFLQSGDIEGHTFMERMLSADSFSQIFIVIEGCLRHNPTVVILNLVLFTGIVFFTDTHTAGGNRNYVFGILHGILQLFNLYVLIWIFTNLNQWLLPELSIYNVWKVSLFSLEMILIGGFLSTFIFGIYLLVSTLIVHNHPTEAFSSFRWTGYKNFLRIHITGDNAKIYPVGVKKVVRNWKNVGERDQPVFKGDEIKAELIEEPVVLNKRKHEEII